MFDDLFRLSLTLAERLFKKQGPLVDCMHIQYLFTPVTLILCRKLNARNIQLCHDTKGETVGVLCRNGEYRYLPWLGFLDRSEASHRGKSVKLLIHRIGQGDADGWNIRWVDVGRGRHVQGCLTSQGVFAVVVQNVKVV